MAMSMTPRSARLLGVSEGGEIKGVRRRVSRDRQQRPDARQLVDRLHVMLGARRRTAW
jgi:hypothetical protein